MAKPSLPLAELRLWPSHHRAALAWWGLFYRDPMLFREELESILQLKSRIKATFCLYAHALPWLFLVVVLGCWLLVVLFQPELPYHGWAALPRHDFWMDSVFWLASGLAFGLAYGLTYGLTEGLAVGLTYGRSVGLLLGLAFGLAVGLLLGLLFGLAFGLASGLAGGLAGGLAEGLAFGLALGLAFFISLTRAYYLPVHFFFLWPNLKANRYPRHPVAWDQMCGARFFGLGRLLVAWAQAQPQHGRAEIERLIDTYPSQRQEALWAKTVLAIRDMAMEADLAKLPAMAAGLPRGKRGYPSQTEQVESLLSPVAAGYLRLRSQASPWRKLAAAENLRAAVEQFHGQVSGFARPLGPELRQAADQWRTLANNEVAKAQANMGKEKIPACFKAGGELKMDNDAFVKREGVLEKLEDALEDPRSRASLILQGRRRTGKSSLIANLRPFLPEDVLLVDVSMQSAASRTSQNHFAASIASQICQVVPEAALGPPPEREMPLCEFEDLARRADELLGAQRRQLLIVVDEYETIDSLIGEGRFHADDILSLLRVAIEKRRNIFWMFVGTHHIAELRNAQWASYLISPRTIAMPRFTPDETRVLLLEPMRHASAEHKVVHKESSWGGSEGIARIHQETGGWPYFVQLLAENLRGIINNTPQATTVTAKIFERARREAVDEAESALRQILAPDLEGAEAQWEYLRGFVDQEEQPPPTDREVLQGLLWRDLIERHDNCYRLTVPLFRLWIAKQP